MSPPPARFELDAAVRRRDRGRLLIGGAPPRLLRLSDSAVAMLDEILRQGPSDQTAKTLARRLERHGLIHPVPGQGESDPPVTVVVPVLDGGDGLPGLVRVLSLEGPVIVVDDGSGDGSPEQAAAAGAEVIENDGAPGPAGARNTGLRAARTDLVAFLDADCVVAPGWRAGLASLIESDPGLALVAPRVRGVPGSSSLARYERRDSPLDLGPAASLVGVDRRISYLPSAALIARRGELLEVGGFDESMRFGEDVDLVWRLLGKGRRARYAPAREVLHRPRRDRRAFAAQRAGYGGSAPDLHRRHPGLAAPLRVGTHSPAVWAAGLALGPRAVPPALATSLLAIASHGHDLPSRAGLVQLGLRGHASATRHLARALTREWLPLTLVLAARDRRARALLAAAFAIDAWPSVRRARRPRELVATAGLHALDHAAYSAGLWRASVSLRTCGALLPRIGSPPGSR